MIDEAFGRGSDESTRYGLELFRRLNLQLLIVTPLQKISVIEPYVLSVGFVSNEDGPGIQIAQPHHRRVPEGKSPPGGAAFKMTPWTTSQQVKDKVRKDWEKGTLPAAYWSGQPEVLPYRIALKGPSSAEWSDRFDEARRWIAAWDGFPIEWREFVHPRLGRNRVPAAVVLPTWDPLLALIGKKTEAERYRRWADALVGPFPELRPWVTAQASAVLSHGDDWPRILAVLTWLRHHPRPGIYLRQLDLPGIHTKFLEGHRGLLSTLLDLILPPRLSTTTFPGRLALPNATVSWPNPGWSGFRHLDPGHPFPRDVTLADRGLGRDGIHLPQTVFVTENETNFLAFPDHSDSLVVFGSGYGFEAWGNDFVASEGRGLLLGETSTPTGSPFLDQLRSRLPKAQSLMMDEETLLTHQTLWGEESDPTNRTLTRLTGGEQEVYQGLVTHRWGERIRLEQERIGYHWVLKSLSQRRNPETLRRSLTGLLDDYSLQFLDEAEVVFRFREFLASGEPLQGKSNPRRHITASTWIVNTARSKALLTHHAKLNKWVQLGGHTDEGEDWTAAALREAREESGLTGLNLVQPGLFDLDIHEIPARPGHEAHDHYDLRFLVEADDAVPLTISDESHDLAWVLLSDLESFTQEESQLRMKRKTYL